MEVLPDPYKDRPIKSVPPPCNRPLPTQSTFQRPNDQVNSQPNWELIRDFLAKEGRLSKPDFVRIINQTTRLLLREPNLIQVEDPVNVIGDLHGQYFDLLNLLQMTGPPSQNNKLVFLGDYVDRGVFAVEILVLVFSLKLCYPQYVFLLRGNHESRAMSGHHNFKEECVSKYDQEVYDLLMYAFDCLPLSVVISQTYICMHGGINNDLCRSTQEVNRVSRFQEISDHGIQCDIIWSDPMDENDYRRTRGVGTFLHNDKRGCGVRYGHDSIMSFLKRNRLKTIIRAHEVFNDGYKFHDFETASKQNPTVVTVFSAPNYVGSYNNLAAFIRISNGNMNIQQFRQDSHQPFVVDGFADAFQCVLPEITKCVSKMMTRMLASYDLPKDAPEDEEQLMKYFIQEHKSKSAKKKNINESQVDEMTEQKKERIKGKVKFFSKMQRYKKILRENSSVVAQLKLFSEGNKLQSNMLSQGSGHLLDQLAKFQQIKEEDEKNERKPYTNQSGTSDYAKIFMNKPKINQKEPVIELPSKYSRPASGGKRPSTGGKRDSSARSKKEKDQELQLLKKRLEQEKALIQNDIQKLKKSKTNKEPITQQNTSLKIDYQHSNTLPQKNTYLLKKDSQVTSSHQNMHSTDPNMMGSHSNFGHSSIRIPQEFNYNTSQAFFQSKQPQVITNRGLNQSTNIKTSQHNNHGLINQSANIYTQPQPQRSTLPVTASTHQPIINRSGTIESINNYRATNQGKYQHNNRVYKNYKPN